MQAVESLPETTTGIGRLESSENDGPLVDLSMEIVCTQAFSEEKSVALQGRLGSVKSAHPSSVVVSIGC